MRWLSLHHPLWGMAFRPLYLLAAVYGAWSIVLWGFGYAGTPALPGWYWHAHEMIWGYAGAVVVGFLLTAMATWTGQPRVQGWPLILLVCWWLLARAGAFVAAGVMWGGVAGALFYGSAAVLMGRAVWRSRNRRNYLLVLALAVFGGLGGVFQWRVATGNFAALHSVLWSGLAVVAGFIGAVGMRVIPFFTAKRLGGEQVVVPSWVMLAVLLLPLLAALLWLWQTALSLAALALMLAAVLGGWQWRRWWRAGVTAEPMLWVLFAGFAFTEAGLLVMGMAHWQPRLNSLGVHLVAVGGIGVMTVGMMVRTALGHTGRPLYPAPRPMRWSFVLMLLAALVRALAAVAVWWSPTAYEHSLRVSALLFAAALLLYGWRYLPWLLAPRVDGKPG